MSIVFSEVENKHNCKPGFIHGAAGIVRAEIDPKTTNQYALPSDYKYFSCLLPRKSVNWMERLQNFKVRHDDIWIIGFPKTGTTWMQNIVHQLRNNFKFETEYIPPDFNYFELPILFDKVDCDESFFPHVEFMDKGVDTLDALPSPRMIKSHLPAYLLPKEIWTVQAKIIYVHRDPKDVAFSMFYMAINHVNPFQCTAHDFYHGFYNDYIVFGPFYAHNQSYFQLRHLDHVLIISYEEMSADTLAAVKRVDTFFGFSHSDEELQQLVQYVSFEKMSKGINFGSNEATGYRFCRKGIVGSYQDEMSEEDINNFNKWTTRQKKDLMME